MEINNTLNELYNANALYESFLKCKSGSDYKYEVQNYEMNLLKNIYETNKALYTNTYNVSPTNDFILNERGKIRQIEAPRFYDRIVQRTLCCKVLNPIVNKYAIYDNGASIVGKGVSFTRKRLETHLHKFFRLENNNHGYILKIDFKKFFDNINHEQLYNLIDPMINNNDIMNLFMYLVNIFAIDVSYMSDEEYSCCYNKVFNHLEYSNTISNEQKTGDKFMHKSIGIGNQIAQDIGILYPTPIDNYCKIVRGLKFYGRYMDDIYIIHKDKYVLIDILNNIRKICSDMGIFINENKTQLINLERDFTFLKIKYLLTETGKVIKSPCKENIKMMKRTLRKLKDNLSQGKLHYKYIEDLYKAWRGNLAIYNSYNILMGMDTYFNNLFMDYI